MQPLEQKIIRLLEKIRHPLQRREIAEHLRLKGGERKHLTRILDQLVRAGQLQEKKGSYHLPPQDKKLEGTFSIADKGYGFLRPDDPQAEDVFIPARHVGSAMDGDRILIACHTSLRDRRPYGKLLRIVERAHPRLLGHYRPRGKSTLVWPLEQKLGEPVRVEPHPEAKPGDIVEVEIERYASGDFSASGRITDVLGAADDPRIDIETVIRSHNLPHQFSPAAIKAATQAGETIDPDEAARRTDLRELPLVTIDGETAKDFDDAVALRKEGDDYRLWVCIADVAHYVEPGSALDLDALERGTSVYFPGFCLPMLPESLSNGLCSLNPDAERLVMCAEMLFNIDGERLAQKFYPAVMRSRARLTYTRVAQALDDPSHADIHPELVPMLQQMAELARALTGMRIARGSLDLDLPEVEVITNERGEPVDLVKVARNQAHRLIEEFMLAANEAVASYLTNKHWPLLYRIHEKPDLLKLQELQQLAAQCGVGLVLGKKLQQALQNLLEEISDKPEARLVNQQLLRSLQQACYAPENVGHFGLAADCYCHFTSPIRRYPDLSVHRVLKQALEGKPKAEAPTVGALKILGNECSAKERRAMQAERDLVELRRCQVMAGRVGATFDGVISSVAEFGFFVELDDIFVDGLVHIRSLQDDFYDYDPAGHTLTGQRRRRQFRVGMRVRVEVKKVELWRRRIDFKLIGVI